MHIEYKIDYPTLNVKGSIDANGIVDHFLIAIPSGGCNILVGMIPDCFHAKLFVKAQVHSPNFRVPLVVIYWSIFMLTYLSNS